MITPEEYLTAKEALDKSNKQIKEAQENIRKSNQMAVYAINKRLSGLTQLLNDLGLSTGSLRLIKSTYKAFGPGIKTEQIREILPYITKEALTVMTDYSSTKIKEIVLVLAQFGEQIE